MSNGKNNQSSGRPPYMADPQMRHSGLSIPQRPSNLELENTPKKQPLVETKTDYGKYRYFKFFPFLIVFIIYVFFLF